MPLPAFFFNERKILSELHGDMQNAAEMTATVLRMTYSTLSNKIERNPLPGKFRPA